jgi:tetratricopeptide (TPR) repeat protein
MKKNSPLERTLECKQRLSHSLLWDLQTAAYCQFGMQAWIEKGVPFYPTSNPYIARQYAQVVIGYLRDCLRADSPTSLDLSQPIYILDLGAGSGRFGYLFLNALRELLPVLHREIDIRYVMTDIVAANIEFWRSHPYLQPYFREKILDFAFYHHAEQEAPIKLLLSGEELSSQTLKNPLILIGNYFFDTIPQDLFLTKEGKMYEGRITLAVEENPQTEHLLPKDPTIINYLKTYFDYVPIDNIDQYYADAELNHILKSYSTVFNDIPILFPEGAFKSIQYFTRLSRGRLLLLAGDQGHATEKQLAAFKTPYISKHGSFSIPVNYHAIAKYFKSQGGASLLTTHSHPAFVVSASILGGMPKDYCETQFAFKNYVDYFEPIEYFLLLEYTEKEWFQPDLEAILLLIKLGNWDPINAHIFFDRIMRDLPNASMQIKDRLAETIDCIWEKFFPISVQEADFIMNLGVIFFTMERYDRALTYFKRALNLKNHDQSILKNIAICEKKLGVEHS